MALGKCRECGKEVSSEAKVCPSCGVKKPVKKTSMVTWIVLGFIAVSVVSAINASPDKVAADPAIAKAVNVAQPSAPVASSQSTLEATAQQVKLEPPKTKWIYHTNIDPMTDKEARFAAIDSDNLLSFDFPYGGHNQPRLTLRKHPKYGLDVYLQIDKGQFLCSSYDGCQVEVRFDDKKPVRYAASEPDDHSTTILFIQSEKAFIENLKKSKTVKIAANFYKEGAPVMIFQTAGLEWK